MDFFKDSWANEGVKGQNNPTVAGFNKASLRNKKKRRKKKVAEYNFYH